MNCPNCNHRMVYQPAEPSVNVRACWACPDADCGTDCDPLGYEIEPKPTADDELPRHNIELQLAIRPLGIAGEQ